MRYYVLSALLLLAACGSAEQAVPAPKLASLHYDCEGHMLDVNNENNTIMLHNARGTTVLEQVASDTGVKYTLQNASKKPIIFTSNDDTAKLSIGKKSYGCKGK